MSETNPFFSPITINGETIEFDHLEPFQLLVPSEKVGRDLTVDVRFTNHCFSFGDEDTEVEEGELYDHNGRRRIFCPTRYELSLSLPDILERLNHPAAKVWQTTARRNWTHIVQVDSPELPYEGPYYVFFEIRKAASAGRGGDDLKMTVESAYHELEGYDTPKTVGKMGFQLLCGKTYLGEPVATKR